MKKIQFLIPVLIIAAAFLISFTAKNMHLKAAPVEKNIAFAFYKESDYAADVYRNTLASVHIKIEKVSKGRRSVVFQKTFDAITVKDYPSLQEAVAQTVKISNVFDAREHIEVSYILTYNSAGSELQMQSGFVVKGSGTEKLYIGI
ncbi:hypothetical protein I5907_02745 [Panacibacter sp. DH6]|uniref:Uncharacterized protein n=1 Tax=Panacibacter microcysteis TaxID=2793269 RepID=A0A931GT42_9BACT|nr:hypothetical protein [Panacibacter microcysteis]MBG9375131.1 hypothetical protein [Panacibacter microcysteis]